MRRLLCLAVIVVVAAAACGKTPDTGDPVTPGASTAFEKRAAQVAAAWLAGGVGEDWTKGFVPVQGLTIAPQDGFPSGETKNAYQAGWFTTAGQLPTAAGTGIIVYPDGAEQEVPTVSAADAYKAIDKGDAACPGCVTLNVTKAEAGTAWIRTSRGQAQVPVWNFTIEGIKNPIARVAVSPEATKPLPSPSIPEWDRDAALVSAQDLVEVKDSLIEFRLGVGACDKNIIGLAWESDAVIVIGGSVTPPGPEMTCTAQLVLHPVQVSTAPVGGRVILDAITGQPVLLQ